MLLVVTLEGKNRKQGWAQGSVKGVTLTKEGPTRRKAWVAQSLERPSLVGLRSRSQGCVKSSPPVRLPTQGRVRLSLSPGPPPAHVLSP